MIIDKHKWIAIGLLVLTWFQCTPAWAQHHGYQDLSHGDITAFYHMLDDFAQAEVSTIRSIIQDENHDAFFARDDGDLDRYKASLLELFGRKIESLNHRDQITKYVALLGTGIVIVLSMMITRWHKTKNFKLLTLLLEGSLEKLVRSPWGMVHRIWGIDHFPVHVTQIPIPTETSMVSRAYSNASIAFHTAWANQKAVIQEYLYARGNPQAPNTRYTFMLETSEFKNIQALENVRLIPEGTSFHSFADQLKSHPYVDFRTIKLLQVVDVLEKHQIHTVGDVIHLLETSEATTSMRSKPVQVIVDTASERIMRESYLRNNPKYISIFEPVLYQEGFETYLPRTFRPNPNIESIGPIRTKSNPSFRFHRYFFSPDYFETSLKMIQEAPSLHEHYRGSAMRRLNNMIKAKTFALNDFHAFFGDLVQYKLQISSDVIEASSKQIPLKEQTYHQFAETRKYWKVNMEKTFNVKTLFSDTNEGVTLREIKHHVIDESSKRLETFGKKQQLYAQTLIEKVDLGTNEMRRSARFRRMMSFGVMTVAATAVFLYYDDRMQERVDLEESKTELSVLQLMHTQDLYTFEHMLFVDTQRGRAIRELARSAYQEYKETNQRNSP